MRYFITCKDEFENPYIYNRLQNRFVERPTDVPGEDEGQYQVMFVPDLRALQVVADLSGLDGESVELNIYENE